MNRFDELFSQTDRSTFIPFFTLGDPNVEASLRLIDSAIKSGVDAIELGFPFSDPITDGPTNQKSMQRSLRSGTTYNLCVRMVRQIRQKYPDLPIALLLYYNLLFMRGRAAYKELADIGIDAVVCSDLPLEESCLHREQLEANGLGCIQMVAPNTPDPRALKLFQTSSAFTYVISRFGTTGETEIFGQSALNRIPALRRLSNKPAVIGFGISKPEQVLAFWKSGANGVIVGSHFISLIEHNLNNLDFVENTIQSFIQQIRPASVGDALRSGTLG
jgi:tryptophan synthase alpha chain